LLQLVVVDDDDQIVEAIAWGNEGGLPDLTLLALAVAEHDECPRVAAGEAASEGDADAGRDAHPERACRHVEAGQAGHVGVALQPGAKLVEGQDLLHREVPAQGKGSVETDRRMTLREDEAIAIGPVGFVGADTHHAEIEGRQDLGRRQRPAQVACLGLVYAADHTDSDTPGGFLQACDFHRVDRLDHQAPFPPWPGS
jgi:hypothetical protein